MPGFDGTGPKGKGPLTGRKMGKCRDSEAEEKDTKEKVVYGLGRAGRPRGGGRGLGRSGFGKGRGRGFGWGRRYEDDSSKGED